ncbi:MAG: Asp23/Gls24 family envelope stress response protein [Candidatus Sumerlaeia bacterium]|nr:Asp23/Gls24 family envelope stress response protein [Candidatus Sumerlaeia bacterium]
MAEKHGAPALPTGAENDYEMQVRDETQLGSIQIANGVIAKIAERAAQEVDEVRLASSAGVMKRLGLGDEVIRVDNIEEDRVAITLQVQMAYRSSMAEISHDLQKHVKDVVEGMTGRPVDSVNVVIVGLYDKADGED